MVLASRKIVIIALALILTASTGIYAQSTNYQEVPLSKSKAMVRSLLLPGLGEMSVGQSRTGKIFTGIEIGLWLALAESYWSRNMYQSRLEAYAAVHADISLDARDDTFLLNVGNYMSTEAYNETKQRERLPADVYPDEENFTWRWDSNESRGKYGTYWSRRNRADEIALFVMGGMVLNRIISVIDVSYIFGNKAEGVEVSLLPVTKNGTVGLELYLGYGL
tara:strand:+ start:791 stop:1453 length:663 start_codon:yes stop_codon:yes gene_type:complete